ncbi:MAG: hypothetical protein ACRC67_07150 [Inquilinus sp.]|uniref:hypothetical protein n=1 Tax=Inquilinus sp. TaxID=1932117 RepID=UPI003F393F75
MPDGAFFPQESSASTSHGSIVALSAKLNGINADLLRKVELIERLRKEGRSEDDFCLKDELERRDNLISDRGDLAAEIQLAPAKTPFEAALKLQCCVMELDGPDDELDPSSVL